ncbi:hypothetical protein TH62_14880 [Bacillus sp. TH008]|nr:hypothetical protein TH62_14880 [Bacillus sp. TH008]
MIIKIRRRFGAFNSFLKPVYKAFSVYLRINKLLSAFADMLRFSLEAVEKRGIDAVHFLLYLRTAN